MLCSHSHHFSTSTSFFHGRNLRNPNPNITFPFSTTLHFPTKPLLSSPTSVQTHNSHATTPSPSPTATPEQPLEVEVEDGYECFPRKQNSRSSSLLRLLQSPDHQQAGVGNGAVESGAMEEEEKKRRMLEELEVIGKRRNPRFPGAIDFPKPDDSVGELVRDDERALRHALEIRRGVAAEILKVAMRANRISINYSNNLVAKLPEFVDLVLIEAAAMKGVPEFAHMTFNARARSYIQNSGIVALVKWLKHNSMSYPQIGKLICMCPGNLGLLRRTVEWLKSIQVKGEYLGNVLVKAGPIWERGVEELDGIINCLEKNGLRRDWMGFAFSRCPKLLALSMEELEQRVRFYMDMGMNEKDFGTMVFDYPKALGFFSLEEMNGKVTYLKEFGLDTHDVGRLLAYKPQLMGCSVEERWKPLVKYLYYLGVRRDGMKRMLMVKPMIFCVDLEMTIAPKVALQGRRFRVFTDLYVFFFKFPKDTARKKVRFLQDIGIREDTIGSVLVKFPPILTYSLYKKIRPVVIFLMTKAGVSEKNIGKVIALEPELVGCSIVHKLDVNVKYFLSLGIRLRTLGEMVADFPMLLKYNLDVLRPKYRYLRRVMVRPLEDLIEFPRYFSYSLEGRIIPRHKVLVDNRINFKLRYMLAGSDKSFEERVKFAIEKRRRFESGNKDNYEPACNSTPTTSETDNEPEISSS